MRKINVENCTCGECEQWRQTVKLICKDKNLDYDKISLSEKVELYHTFVITDTRYQDHNWKIMEPRFRHALIGKE